MDEIPVVTCFCRHDGRVLLLRRSARVGSYRGQWGGVAGHVAADDADPAAPDREPIDAAVAEIREETGIEDARLVRAGEPFAVEDADRGTRWFVHPFLFDVDDPAVDTNDETDAVEWVHAPEIRRRGTIPDLWESYDRVRPRVADVREDTTRGAATLSLRALEILRDEAALAADGSEPTGSERTGNEWESLAELAWNLLEARPSMAVVANRIDRAMAAAASGGGQVDETAAESATTDSGAAAEKVAAIEAAAVAGIDRAVAVDEDAAAVAAAELPDRVATLSRSGTVRDALLAAEPAAILVAESRPGGEGVGVAESLARELPDTEVTLTTDAALAAGLASWNAGALLVGADRILPDGRVVNKVGTRGAALAAPADCSTDVVASTDKVATDEAVDVEPRDADELYDGDAPVGVDNPTFDVTPADAIDAVLTERGAQSAAAVTAVADEHRARQDW